MAAKVLIVDDALLIHRRMYEVALRSYREPIEAHFAADGAGALRQLQTHPDTALVLLDVNLPLLSGLEFFERLEAEPPFAGIPVVLQGSDGQADDIRRGFGFGVRGYLTRPFAPAQLHALLDDVLHLAGVA